MPVYQAPGVYVEEEERGPKPIPGVSTSNAAFIGMCKDGPPLVPTGIDSFDKFERIFGGITSPNYPLPYAVRGFFENGGRFCFIVRVSDATQSKLEFMDSRTSPASTIFTLKSKTYGAKAKDLKATLTRDGADSLTPAPVGLAWTAGVPVTVDATDMAKVTIDAAATFKFVAGDRVTYDDGDENHDTEDRTVLTVKGKNVELDKPLTYTPDNGATLSLKALTAGDVRFRVTEALTFFPGSVIKMSFDENVHYDVVVGKDGNHLTLAQGVPDTFPSDLTADPEVKITTVEFTLEVEKGAAKEVYKSLGLFPGHPNYFVDAFKGSGLVTLELPETGAATPEDIESTANVEEYLPETAAESFAGGTNDTFGPADVAGISTLMDEVADGLERVRDVNLVAFPGITDSGIQASVIGHCEKMKYRFAILDAPVSANGGPAGPEAALTARKAIGSDRGHAAYYYPWLVTRDGITGEKIEIPASGHVAGVYARSDTTRGVHKAPANEQIRNIVGLSYPISFAENERLNPEGVNCLRAFPGRGNLVWGARTISKNPSWTYVNVRRLFIYLEDSIERGTHWVVFEPNNEKLWARVRQTITNFLIGVWRANMLMGTTPEEAFFVRCDRTTMTQDDIDNGRLICVIGVAPVKPAEFVIFRIAQWTAGSEVT